MTEQSFKDGQIIIRRCDMFSEEGLGSLTAGSVAAIITDFPYGIANKRGGTNNWDSPVDLARFWEETKTIRGNSTPVITTSSMPFTATLVASNPKEFKYTWVWEKSKASGYLNAKKQPMRAHEDIVVFCNGACLYNPQMTPGTPYDKGTAVRDTPVYGEQTKAVHVHNDSGLRYPRSVQYFKTAESEGKLHPTQKPVALFEYLIKTYTNEGDLVLDPCMGSGTTALACLRTGRRFIGFEVDETFFERARLRISEKIEKKS